MTVADEGLLPLLGLEMPAPDEFLGRCREGAADRVFGGHVAAQALLAAGRTVDEGQVAHSLHAGFIKRGRPAEQLRYSVQRLRDSRSYSTRLVMVRQADDVIFHATVSFQTPETGSLDHQLDVPSVPSPDQAPELIRHPIEVRPALWTVPLGSPDQRLQEQYLWVRSAVRLPDDPLLHACALTFASDLTLGWAPWKSHGVHRVTSDMFGASLDHTMWFHRPFRADEWLLLHQSSPSASGGRGLALGQVYDASGTLVATLAQEGVLRRGPVTAG